MLSKYSRFLSCGRVLKKYLNFLSLLLIFDVIFLIFLWNIKMASVSYFLYDIKFKNIEKNLENLLLQKTGIQKPVE